MSANQNIEYKCEDKIALISLNRPQKLNAIDDDMVRSLMATLHQFDMDDEAHTAILCGNGRAFCSGADVRARQLRSAEELKQKGGPSAGDAKSSDIFMRSVNWKPVIAAVHGYVLGLGIGLALDCELVVAEAGTKFQITETPRGLAGSGKYMNLLAYRGLGSFATEVTLTGRYLHRGGGAGGRCDRQSRPSGQAHRSGSRARRGDQQQSTSGGPRKRHATALANRGQPARGHPLPRSQQAVPDGGFRGGHSRFRRETEAEAVQSALALPRRRWVFFRYLFFLFVCSYLFTEIMGKKKGNPFRFG